MFSRSVQITSENESVDLTTKTDSSLTWYTYLPQELTAEEGVVFFDPESPFFQKMLNICAGLLAAACLFGIIYHLVFYKPIQRKKHGTFYACTWCPSQVDYSESSLSSTFKAHQKDNFNFN